MSFLRNFHVIFEKVKLYEDGYFIFSLELFVPLSTSVKNINEYINDILKNETILFKGRDTGFINLSEVILEDIVQELNIRNDRNNAVNIKTYETYSIINPTCISPSNLDVKKIIGTGNKHEYDLYEAAIRRMPLSGVRMDLTRKEQENVSLYDGDMVFLNYHNLFVYITNSTSYIKYEVYEIIMEFYKIYIAKLNCILEEVSDYLEKMFYECKKAENARLIVGYSNDRARKDRYNREKGVRRLEKEFEAGTLTKAKVTKRGYNKFLEISKDVKVSINREKIKEDERWDGLKGYVTNTELSAKTVCEEYSGLWQVERAFRITKGTLEMRPVFHFTKKRIEAHVCICFVAYKVYKEMERILKKSGMELSVDKVLDIAKTITTIKVRLPASGDAITRTMLLTERHKSIAKLFDEDFWRPFWEAH
jgi:hypothetical protein